MKEKIFNNKNRLIFLISSLILLIVLYIILIFINYSSLKKYDNGVELLLYSFRMMFEGV